jgi:hypothetical protein
LLLLILDDADFFVPVSAFLKIRSARPSIQHGIVHQSQAWCFRCMFLP